MKIVNPLYDNAFKYLMDNDRIAKIVLSIILDTQVITLQAKPQETPDVQVGNFNIFRFDYKAVIRNPQGENVSVLIEVQKHRSIDAIPRFRNYLGTNYMKTETIINAKGDEETAHLPIITIYLLGFDLPEFPCRAIRVDNRPYDIVGQKYLDIRSRFVELLTHQSFVLIAADKPQAEKRNTRLDKFLNLFIQKIKNAEANSVIDVEEEQDTDIQQVVNHLNHGLLDVDLLRKLQTEQEFSEGIKTLEQKIVEVEAREEEAQKQKEEAQKQKEEAQIKLAKKMKKYGEPIEEIIKETGLTNDVIEKL